MKRVSIDQGLLKQIILRFSYIRQNGEHICPDCGYNVRKHGHMKGCIFLLVCEDADTSLVVMPSEYEDGFHIMER